MSHKKSDDQAGATYRLGTTANPLQFRLAKALQVTINDMILKVNPEHDGIIKSFS